MSDYRVAYRYAKSLIDLAEEQGNLNRVHEDLVLFKKVADQNRDFRLMLRNPLIDPRKKIKIVLQIFKDKISDLTIMFIEIVGKKSRESLLPEVSKVFLDLYNQKMGIITANVTTKFKLDDKLRAQFTNIVKERMGASKVELHERIDPELIGGYILRVGDLQIDNSLDSRLNALKLQLIRKE